MATVALKVDLKSKVPLSKAGMACGRGDWSSEWRDSIFSGGGKVLREGQGHSE